MASPVDFETVSYRLLKYPSLFLKIKILNYIFSTIKKRSICTKGHWLISFVMLLRWNLHLERSAGILCVWGSVCPFATNLCTDLNLANTIDGLRVYVSRCAGELSVIKFTAVTGKLRFPSLACSQKIRCFLLRIWLFNNITFVAFSCDPCISVVQHGFSAVRYLLNSA